MKEKLLTYQINIFGRSITPRKVLEHPFISGSAIMIVGVNFTNFVAYFYHFVLGRMLGPVHYGELASIISIMGIITSVYTFVGLVIVKLVSTSKEKDVANITSWFHNNLLKIGLVVLIVFVPLSTFIGKFLHISKWVVLIIPFSSILYLLVFVYRSVLQGIMKFREVVIPSGVDISLRLVLGAIFVYFGLSVFGGVLAIFLGALLGYLLYRRYVIRLVGLVKPKSINHISPNLFKNSIPILVSSLATFSLFNADLLLAKHYLDAHTAGIYASLSTLGKVIYYGTSPVNAVMFPFISKRHSEGNKYTKVLVSSLLATISICALVLFVYYLKSELMVKMLFGSAYTDASNSLFLFGIFIALLSTSSLLVNYFISKEKNASAWLISVASLIQIFGIIIYHQSIGDIIHVSIVASASLMFMLSVLLIQDQAQMFQKSYELLASRRAKR